MFSNLESISARLRKSTGIVGLLLLIFGLFILFWPGKTATFVTFLVGLSFILIGVSSIFSIFSFLTNKSRNREETWWHWGQFVLGLVYLFVGIFSFIDLAAATTYLFILVGIFVGMTWIIEGFIGFTTLKYFSSKGWIIFSSVLSVIAGFMLFLTPFWGAVTLWFLLGISFLVLGIIKIISYFTWTT